MTVDTMARPDYEKTLLDIVRALPPHRAEQLVDFARFLEGQLLAEELLREENPAEIEAENARWDALLASDDSQALLEQLAQEALEAHRRGRTRPMTFDSNGQLRSE